MFSDMTKQRHPALLKNRLSFFALITFVIMSIQWYTVYIKSRIKDCSGKMNSQKNLYKMRLLLLHKPSNYYPVSTLKTHFGLDADG